MSRPSDRSNDRVVHLSGGACPQFSNINGDDENGADKRGECRERNGRRNLCMNMKACLVPIQVYRKVSPSLCIGHTVVENEKSH